MNKKKVKISLFKNWTIFIETRVSEFTIESLSYLLIQLVRSMLKIQKYITNIM